MRKATKLKSNDLLRSLLQATKPSDLQPTHQKGEINEEYCNQAFYQQEVRR
jgi:hypothetical protein